MDDRLEPCDVWELARKRGSVSGVVALRQLPRLAAALLDTADRLQYRFTGSIDERGRPAALLELEGRVHALCDHCGKPVAVPIGEQARFFFVVDEEELGRLPIDDAPDEPLLGSERFDLAALIEDQAILALPISPRHEGCQAAAQALPPAQSEPVRRPFAALVELKRRGQ